MDSLHAIGFYVSSGVLLLGGAGVALLPGRGQRGAALAISGVGLAGLYAVLSAGFVAVIALVCYLAVGWMIAGPRHRMIENAVAPIWRQAGAVGAAALLAVLAFSAYRGSFVHADLTAGPFEARAVARLLLAHDALAAEAVAALGAIAVIAATAAWRSRERAR